jgi:hypothetical protein
VKPVVGTMHRKASPTQTLEIEIRIARSYLETW